MGMLVLSRKKDASIWIGPQEGGKPLVKVMVIDIRGDKVRLGVEASSELAVHRKEIWLQIAEQKAVEPAESAGS